jgi:hypothetical protein
MDLFQNSVSAIVSTGIVAIWLVSPYVELQICTNLMYIEYRDLDYKELYLHDVGLGHSGNLFSYTLSWWKTHIGYVH